MNEAAALLWRELNAAIERRLITRLEEIEGRVPTDDEVRAFLLCGIWPAGKREYKWRGQTILVVITTAGGWKISG